MTLCWIEKKKNMSEWQLKYVKLFSSSVTKKSELHTDWKVDSSRRHLWGKKNLMLTGSIFIYYLLYYEALSIQMNVVSLSIKPNLTNHLQLKIIFDIVLRVTFCSWQWHYRTGFQSVLNNVHVSICTYIKTSYACCDRNHSFLSSHVPGTPNVSDRGQNPQPSVQKLYSKVWLNLFLFPLFVLPQTGFLCWAAQQGWEHKEGILY